MLDVPDLETTRWLDAEIPPLLNRHAVEKGLAPYRDELMELRRQSSAGSAEG